MQAKILKLTFKRTTLQSCIHHLYLICTRNDFSASYFLHVQYMKGNNSLIATTIFQVFYV